MTSFYRSLSSRSLRIVLCSASLATLAQLTGKAEANPANPVPQLAIEAAMRTWQERYQAVMAKPVKWPKRVSDGVLPGDYPIDCFYHPDLTSDARAAALVRALAESMTEVERDPTRMYYDSRTDRLRFYPVPVLSHFIFSPADGELDGKDYVSVARVVFETPPSSNMLLFERPRADGPFVDITEKNYRDKFYQICTFLSLIDLPLIDQTRPFGAVKFMPTEQVVAIGLDLNCQTAKNLALSGFLAGARDDSAEALNPTVSIDNLRRMNESPPRYESQMRWAAGYYRVDATKLRGRVTPYVSRADYSTRRDGDVAMLEGGGPATAIPVYEPTNFPKSFPTRFVKAAEPFAGQWMSPVYRPQDRTSISNSRVPCGTGSTPDKVQSDRWSLGLDLLVQRNWKHYVDAVTTECGCTSCASDAELCSVPKNNSVDFRLNLGSGPEGSYGSLQIAAERPNVTLPTPAALQRHTGKDVESIIDYTQCSVPDRMSPNRPTLPFNATPDLDRLSLSTRPLRQLISPEWVMDVQVASATRYALVFFHRAEVGAASSATGLFDVTDAVPYATYTIESPAGDLNHLRITAQTAGGNSAVTDYRYDPTTDGWSMATGTGTEERHESVVWRIEGQDRIQRRTITDAAGTVVAAEESRFRAFAWNDPLSPVREERFELVEHVSDPDGEQRTTRYRYYEDEGLDRGGYGHCRSVEWPDGSWERYAYDRDGTLVRVIRPFGDTRVTDAEDLCRVTETQESDMPDVDDDARPEWVSLTVERTLGLETARSYRVAYSAPLKVAGVSVTRSDSIRCQSPGAAWNDSSNLVTQTRAYATGPDAGKSHSVIFPDGTMSLTRYERSEERLTTTEETGAADAEFTGIVAGRRLVTRVFSSGATERIETYDIASGLLIDSEYTLPAELDEHGRALTVHYLDGSTRSFGYDCCGLASETDRAGTTTTFLHDSHKRRVGTVRNGIAERSLFDAANRVIETRRTGRDGSTVVLARHEYSVSGRRTTSTDARGSITRFQEEVTPTGGRRAVTLHADLSKRIEEYHRDGTLAEISGSAMHPVKYRYAVKPATSGDRSLNALVTTEIRPGPDGEETEWIDTSTDMLGRVYERTLPPYTGSEPVSAFEFYNAKGQHVRSVGFDGVVVLQKYDEQGRRSEVAIDVNGDGEIDHAGADRVTRTEESVVDDPTHGIVERVTESVFFGSESDEPTEVSRMDTSTRNRTSWQQTYGRETRTQTEYLGGGVTKITMDTPDGLVSTSTQTHGQVTAEAIVNAAGETLSSRTLEYDPQGRLSRSLDARNGETRYSYFDDDQLASITTPPPETGQPAQITAYDYDARGRLVETTLSDGAKQYREYTPAGKVKSEHGARQYPVKYTYDPQGRLRTLTTWQNFAARQGMSVTEWNYHPARGSLVAKEYADGTSVRYTYTPSGQMQTRISARGIVTRYGYDATTGDLNAVTYSDDTVPLAFTYDRGGRRTEITDAAGQTRIAYEEGLPLTESYLDGLLTGLKLTRTYDQGRLAGLKATLGSATEYQAGYAYGTAGRVTGVTSGAIEVGYDYLPNSTLLRSVDSAHNDAVRMTTTRTWDHLDRLKSIVSTPAAAASVSTEYAYNAAGQRERATLAEGEFWQYRYDALGQVISGRKNLPTGEAIPGYQFGYVFDDIGNRRRTTTNGRVAEYETNGLNQYEQRTVPRAIDVLGESLRSAQTSVNGVPTLETGKTVDREYFYVPYPAADAGAINLNIRSRVPGSPDQVFDERRVAYHPPAQELFEHDADGNLSRDWRWSYQWDAENRLVAMETTAEAVAAGVPRQRLAFVYDAKGRRLQKKVFRWDGSAFALERDTRFLYDGWNLLAEFGVTSAAPATLVRGRTYLWGLDLSGSLQGAGGVGGLLAVNAVGQTFFPTYDGNGNIVGLVNATDGTESASFEYDPFGNTIKSIGPAADVQPFGFSTKYADGETGLIYFGLRYCSVRCGRWLSTDPIEEHGGVNLYGFVQNDPLDELDYLGAWDSRIHLLATTSWANEVEVSAGGAALIGQKNDAVDEGKLDWRPFVGDQRYHFNRTPSNGDSRLTLFKEHLEQALRLCAKDTDDWLGAANNLGMALHPVQDSVAHSYHCVGSTDWSGIIPHNALSGQGIVFTGVGYPDDPTLDAYMLGNGQIHYYKGNGRITLTEQVTKGALSGFVQALQLNGGCKCKQVFLLGADQ